MKFTLEKVIPCSWLVMAQALMELECNKNEGELIWGQGFYLSLGLIRSSTVQVMRCVIDAACLAHGSDKMIMTLCDCCCWVICVVRCRSSACQRSYSQYIQFNALLTRSGQSWCKWLTQMEVDGFGCKERTCGRCKWYESVILMPTHLMLMKAP